MPASRKPQAPLPSIEDVMASQAQAVLAQLKDRFPGEKIVLTTYGERQELPLEPPHGR